MPHQQELSMLRSELDMLMTERQQLLRICGAAAMFVAEVESEHLPEPVWNVAELLAESLNELSGETLQEALESVGAGLLADDSD